MTRCFASGQKRSYKEILYTCSLEALQIIYVVDMISFIPLFYQRWGFFVYAGRLFPGCFLKDWPCFGNMEVWLQKEKKTAPKAPCPYRNESFVILHRKSPSHASVSLSRRGHFTAVWCKMQLIELRNFYGLLEKGQKNVKWENRKTTFSCEAVGHERQVVKKCRLLLPLMERTATLASAAHLIRRMDGMKRIYQARKQWLSCPPVADPFEWDVPIFLCAVFFHSRFSLLLLFLRSAW